MQRAVDLDDDETSVGSSPAWRRGSAGDPACRRAPPAGPVRAAPWRRHSRAKSISLSACAPPAMSSTASSERVSVPHPAAHAASASAQRQSAVGELLLNGGGQQPARRTGRGERACCADGSVASRSMPPPEPVRPAGDGVQDGRHRIAGPHPGAGGASTCTSSRSQPRNPSASAPVNAVSTLRGPACTRATRRRCAGLSGPLCSTIASPARRHRPSRELADECRVAAHRRSRGRGRS